MVLSACATAAHTGDTRDPMSLATAFLRGGAGRVMGPLDLPDRVAASLFEDLHRRLVAGMSAEAALQQLQRMWRARASPEERLAAMALVAIVG